MGDWRTVCFEWIQTRGDSMKIGDLVSLKNDRTGMWKMGILVLYYEQFQGWMVQWSDPRAGRSFHTSRHLEVIV